MSEIIKKREAIEFLGLDEKVFSNYFQIAGEFKAVPREGRGAYKFDKAELGAWITDRASRTVLLDTDDYKACLDFALAMHHLDYVKSDFGSGRQREFGQKITNWVKGQLGEIAVKKFLELNYGTKTELDFDIHDEIVAQDIIGVMKSGDMVEPRIGVGIKTSKIKNAYLILGSNEIVLAERRSDVYIFCRLDIPDDHLLRLTRSKVLKFVEGSKHYHLYHDTIPELSNIPCEIAGYCDYKELQKVTGIPGQDFDGVRYVLKSGLLHRSPDDWRKLVDRL